MPDTTDRGKTTSHSKITGRATTTDPGGCCLIGVGAVLDPLVDLVFWEDLLVAKGYRPVRRDQEFLLPPRMTDWLGDGHLVWFVLDVVAELDTSRLHARAARRRDGQPARSRAGRAGYDPDMLLALLVYGYACGERSSRRIERLCLTDVAFRVICAGDTPDHTVLARFRQAHAESFAELFVQVLRLCRAAGLVNLATVAIDGTKIAANASRAANRGAQWLAAEVARMDREAGEQASAADRDTVERILAEAGQVDAAEDAVFGSARGDELPAGWNGRAGRRERIRAAQARLQAASDAARVEKAAAAAARAERDAQAAEKAQAALAAERDRARAKVAAWEHAWEHAAATPGAPVPKGRAPVEEPITVRRRAQQRLARARERVAHPDTAPRRGGSRPAATAAPPTRHRRPTSPTPTRRSCPPATGGCRPITPSSPSPPTRSSWSPRSAPTPPTSSATPR